MKVNQFVSTQNLLWQICFNSLIRFCDHGNVPLEFEFTLISSFVEKLTTKIHNSSMVAIHYILHPLNREVMSGSYVRPANVET